jgi:hypothetical protein
MLLIFPLPWKPNGRCGRTHNGPYTCPSTPAQANRLLIPAGVMADAWSSIFVTGESISTNGFTTRGHRGAGSLPIAGEQRGEDHFYLARLNRG